MKTIWKWTLSPDTTIDMPIGAKVLAVQVQGREGQTTPPVQLWALVDPGAKKCSRTFRTYWTGHLLPEDPGDYIGTYQNFGGALVFHVFEVKNG